jgi:Protein of unknown function (DUF1566)
MTTPKEALMHPHPILISINSITIHAQPGEVGAQLLTSLADPIAAAQVSAACQGLEIRSDVVIDHATGLMWDREDISAERLTYAAFAKACNDSRVGGYTDWREPTLEESRTIVDYSTHSPSCNKEAFPSCKSEPYWTSTVYAANAGYVWIQHFTNGIVHVNDRDGKFRGRAVRRVAAGQ